MYIFLFFYILFNPAISIAPLQLNYYSEALQTQHWHCVGVSCQSATRNCEWRTYIYASVQQYKIDI